MKDFLKTVAGIVLFIVAAVGVLTLVRNFTRTTSVILTSSECNPPCWSGIKPNQTSSSQVYAILDKLKGVNIDTITEDYDKNDKLTEIHWDFERPIEDSAGSVYFDNDRVTAISILTINSLKLNDLLKKLGQPEQYWTQIGYIENWEYLEVILLYPTKGYLAGVTIDLENKADQVEIQGTTSVFRVTYFAPEMYQDLLKTEILLDGPVNTHTGTFETWSGFGTITFQRK